MCIRLLVFMYVCIYVLPQLKMISGWMICRKTAPGQVETRLWGSNQGLLPVKEADTSSDEDDGGQEKDQSNNQKEDASVGK